MAQQSFRNSTCSLKVAYSGKEKMKMLATIRETQQSYSFEVLMTIFFNSRKILANLAPFQVSDFLTRSRSSKLRSRSSKLRSLYHFFSVMERIQINLLICWWCISMLWYLLLIKIHSALGNCVLCSVAMVRLQRKVWIEEEPKFLVPLLKQIIFSFFTGGWNRFSQHSLTLVI